MSFQVVRSVDVARGRLLEVRVDERLVELVFTWHALDAMKDYEVSIEDALGFIFCPEEVVTGHGDRFIAHRRLVGRRLVRLVYEYEDRMVVVITFYIAFAERYFKGVGEFADKVLS